MLAMRILKVNDLARQIPIFGYVLELNITTFCLNVETTHDNLYKYIIISFLFFLATCVPYRTFLYISVSVHHFRVCVSEFQIKGLVPPDAMPELEEE